MKNCPTCKRTFEDTFTFCLVDGAILSAPYDPQATQRIPPSKSTNPPPTEVMTQGAAAPRNTSLPPTILSSSPGQKAPTFQQTPSADEMKESSRLKVYGRKMLRGAIIGLIVGIVLGIFAGVSGVGKYPADTVAVIAGLSLFIGAIYYPVGRC